MLTFIILRSLQYYVFCYKFVLLHSKHMYKNKSSKTKTSWKLQLVHSFRFNLRMNKANQNN
jgi:hypothetical protein